MKFDLKSQKLRSIPPPTPSATHTTTSACENMLRRPEPVHHKTQSRIPEYDDTCGVDYTSAGLYVVGIQVVTGCICCATTSVILCWLLPRAAISAVRTLAFTCVVGAIFTWKPLRVGKVKGISAVFNALRCMIPLYIMALVVEQIVHTCTLTRREEDDNFILRLVFHSVVVVMIVGGFIRAKSPSSETDSPFLLVTICLVILSLLPPPATALTGPLCEPVVLLVGVERVTRALFFSSLYATHVYAAVPKSTGLDELVLCVARSFTACVWVLGCHLYALVLAPIQVGIILAARFSISDPASSAYATVDQHSDAGQEQVLEYDTADELENGDLFATHAEHCTHRAAGFNALASIGAQHSKCARPPGFTFQLAGCHNSSHNLHFIEQLPAANTHES